MTPDTIAVIKHRNKSRNKVSSDYKLLRNKCNRQLEKDKKSKSNMRLNKDPSQLWKIIRAISSRRNISIITLKETDAIINEDKEVAEKLSSNFTKK